MNLIPPSHPTPEEFVEHLVTVAGGGDDALGAGPAGSGVGAGLEILTQMIIIIQAGVGPLGLLEICRGVLICLYHCPSRFVIRMIIQLNS